MNTYDIKWIGDNYAGSPPTFSFQASFLRYEGNTIIPMIVGANGVLAVSPTIPALVLMPGSMIVVRPVTA